VCTSSHAQRLFVAIAIAHTTLLPTMHFIAGRYAFLGLLIAGVAAHDNGMVMNMDQGMAMNEGNMIMYLHFKLGDNLWFQGWAPRTPGAMVGTCIAFLMLSIAERWLTAMHGVMEAHWRSRAQVALFNKHNASVVATSPEERTGPSSEAAQPRSDVALPLILAYDVPRGIMRLVLASINFLFMLTVMTFQLSFIFSIIIGLGIGEAFFGRYSLQFGPLH